MKRIAIKLSILSLILALILCITPPGMAENALADWDIDSIEEIRLDDLPLDTQPTDVIGEDDALALPELSLEALELPDAPGSAGSTPVPAQPDETLSLDASIVIPDQTGENADGAGDATVVDSISPWPAKPEIYYAKVVPGCFATVEIMWASSLVADYYVIYYSTDLNSRYYNRPYVKVDKSSTIAQLSLEANSTYIITVQAVNYEDGASYDTMSSIRATTLPGNPGMVQFSDDACSATGHSVNLHWSHGPLSGMREYGAAKSFTLYYGTSSVVSEAAVISDLPANQTYYTVENLKSNQAYYFWIQANTAYGSTALDTPLKIDNFLPAPKGLTLSSQEGDVLVTWEAVDGATGYHLYYGKSDSLSEASRVKVGRDPEAILTGLDFDTTYYFWITALDENGEGLPSECRSAITPVAAPIQKAPTSRGNTITLSWNAVDGAKGYRVYYGTESSLSKATMKEAGQDTRITISGLKHNTVYYTWVRALGRSRPSPASSRKSVTTRVAAPIQNPPTATDTSITLSWDAVDGATRYTVYYATVDDLSKAKSIKLGNVTSKTISGLKRDMTYYTWVRAFKKNAGGEPSAVQSVLTQLAKPQIRLTPKETSFTASWEAVKGATDYRLYYGTAKSLSKAREVKTGNVVKKTIKDLKRRTTYYVWLRAINDNAQGDLAGPMKVTTVIAAPVQSEPTSAGNTITVSWKKAAGATGYMVYYGTESDISKAQSVKVGKSTSKKIKGLKNNTTYYTWVKALCKGGMSAASTRKRVQTRVAKPVPTITATDTTVTVSWSAVPGATGYKVFYGTKKSFAKARALNVGKSTSRKIKGLNRNTTYYIWTMAYKGNKEGQASSVMSVTTLPAAPVLKSYSTEEYFDTVDIIVSWNPSDKATEYMLYYGRKDDISSAKAVSVGANTKGTIWNCYADETWYIWVKARGKGGLSAPSQRMKVTVGPKPPVQNDPVSNTDTSLTVSWSPVSNATGYRAACGTDPYDLSGWKWVDAGKATSLTIDGLEYGAHYYTLVQAYNASGRGPLSDNNRSVTIQCFYYDMSKKLVTGAVHMPQDLVIPSRMPDGSSVKGIGDYAFNGLSKGGKVLQSVRIPEGITQIGQHAFEGCNALSSVAFPSTLTSIGNDAFSNCKALTFTALPNGLTSIGDRAFNQCDALAFTALPNSLTSLGEDAFAWCTALQSMTLPQSLQDTGKGTFRSCRSLKTIAFPKGLKAIGSCAFEDCAALQSARIPDTVTSIGYNAFSGCKALAELILPDSVSSIDSWAFGNCSSLKAVRLPNGLTSLALATFSGCSGLESVRLPDGLTAVGPHAFNGTALKTITIPAGVTEIGYYAFYNCKALTAITLPARVKTIGRYAFNGCTALQAVQIQSAPGQVEIGEAAFDNCPAEIKYTG